MIRQTSLVLLLLLLLLQHATSNAVVNCITWTSIHSTYYQHTSQSRNFLLRRKQLLSTCLNIKQNTYCYEHTNLNIHGHSAVLLDPGMTVKK